MSDPLAGLRRLVADTVQRRADDAKRFADLDRDLCQLCDARGADKRSLFIACTYAIHEIVPEAIDLSGVEDEALRRRGYFLMICKACRARLLGILVKWRAECIAMRDVPKDHDGDPVDWDPDRNIPVRVHGAVVMMTADEYREWNQRTSDERAARLEDPHA